MVEKDKSAGYISSAGEDAGAQDHWAIILTRDDGKEEVSITNVGAEPEVRDDQTDGSMEDKGGGGYTVEKVDRGVMIGMVRGGEYFSVGGFGFEHEHQIGTREPPGAVRYSDPAGDVRVKSRFSEPNVAEVEKAAAAERSPEARKAASDKAGVKVNVAGPQPPPGPHPEPPKPGPEREPHPEPLPPAPPAPAPVPPPPAEAKARAKPAAKAKAAAKPAWGKDWKK